jgi:sugar O-acyltransferase (sialic acid O-acetyltransferase NeuD family)
MTRIILFAVGSALVVDYEESCARLGIEIVAAVKNRPGDDYLVKCRNAVSPADIDSELVGVPFICPLFTPGNRRVASREAQMLGLSLGAPLVDPTAIVASSVELGAGTYVNAAATISARTRIATQVVINRSVSLAHHIVLEDFVSIGPGAILAGAVEVGRGALIGAGSLVLPKVRIGAGSIVAAGSVVSRDVEDRTLVAGNPARVVKRDLTDALV